MAYYRATDDDIRKYHEDGYLLVEDFLDPEEASMLLETAREDHVLGESAHDVQDASGRKSRLSLWHTPGDDIYGVTARSERMVSTVDRLLGGEAYHWHSKVMMKEPRVGGAWEWHQDYGYWYHDGVLFPLLTSCSIALDEATRQNGCLQVLKGSHHIGRVDHGRTGEQTGADAERVEAALARHELVYCEMKPGAALFFHCNLFHRSDANTSDRPRWSLICCYNAARNSPYRASWQPSYTPIQRVPDAAIKDTGRKARAAESV